MYLIPFYDLIKIKEKKQKLPANIALRKVCYLRYRDKIRKLKRQWQAWVTSPYFNSTLTFLISRCPLIHLSLLIWTCLLLLFNLLNTNQDECFLWLFEIVAQPRHCEHCLPTKWQAERHQQRQERNGLAPLAEANGFRLGYAPLVHGHGHGPLIRRVQSVQ